MTERQKFLIGFIIGIMGLGVFWYVMIDGKKGEPKEMAPLSSTHTSNFVSASQKENVKVEITRSIVESFLQTFFSFQGDQPEKHIEAVKPYVIPYLYEDWKQHFPRPTSDIFSQRLIQITDAHGISIGSEIEWSVGVVVEVIDYKGAKRMEEWTYVISLVNENGWKISEVSQRGIID